MRNALENYAKIPNSPVPRPPPPPLQNPNEHITAPEYAMQIVLVPGLPPSGGYENIVTAMECIFPLFICLPDIKSRRHNNRQSDN